eukprot:c20382_g1_i1 orf=144-3356(+)
MMEGGSSGDNSHAQTSDSSVKLMEIKIKTLDSQVYTCNVDQNMTVPALKEHIATLTGVPVENQRLICRGKVLKDDHNLSAYNVEDGHTLHLVTRQVPQPGAPSSSAGANAGEEEQGGEDSLTAASRNRPTQISHSVVMGTFNVPDNGDGGLPDVNRIISSVLQSLGMGVLPNAGANPVVNPAGVVPAVGGQDTGAGSGRPATAGNQPPPSERGVAQAMWPIAGPGILPAIGQQFRLLQQATVIPDALTTISQYLDGLQQALATNGQQHTLPSDAPHLNTAPSQPASSPAVIRGHPTPANLGAVIRRTMGLINGHAGLELDRLSSQLENEANLADTGVRSEVQSAALRDGVLLQHLGALLLELGRATLTLRMGTSAMESTVNAGPAVFISPAGPNPMMVQPLPFQSGPGFGTTNVGTHHNTGMMGFGEAPRNVSIHIHANDAGTIPGFPAAVQGVAPGNAAPQVPAAAPSMVPGNAVATTAVAPSVHAIAVPIQVSGPSTLTEQPGLRVVPMQTVVAAVPATLQSRPLVDNSGVHPNLLHPLLARFQQLNSQQGGSLPAVVMHGTPPGSSAVPPPASTAQQPLNSVAPTIRAQLQVQAWVPDGHGGSRLVSNEEALRTLLSHTQAASLSTPQQQPSQDNRTVSQSNPLGETGNVNTDANGNHPAVGQQVMNDVCEEPVVSTIEQVHETARDVPCQAEVDNNNSNQGKDLNTGSGSSLESSEAETQPKERTTTNIPAGLGLRGLQPLPSRTPKRPARHVASTSEQAVQNQNSPSALEQGGLVPPAGGQRNAQGSPLIPDTGRSVPSQMLPVFQLLNHMPSRRGGGGNFDIASLVSQFARNAGGTTASTRARDQDQGLGLPAGALGNLMGQVMQNPFMRNVVQQVVEQVGEEALEHEDLTAQGTTAQGANPQGGLDFSRLLQEMMPVVSQAINRVNNTTGSEQASSLLQGVNARTGGESVAVRGGTEAVREGSVGLQDMLSNGLNASNGSNLSALFQQMMPVVAQAFGGAHTNRPEQPSGIPMNMNLSSGEDGGRGTADQQRDETSQLGTGQPESTTSERSESAPVAKRQKKQ